MFAAKSRIGLSGCHGKILAPKKSLSHRRQLAAPHRLHRLSPPQHHTCFRPSKPRIVVANASSPSQSEPATPPNRSWWSYLFGLMSHRMKRVLKPDWSQYHLPSPKEVVWKTACVLFAMVVLALIMSVLDSGLMKMYQCFFVKS